MAMAHHDSYRFFLELKLFQGNTEQVSMVILFYANAYSFFIAYFLYSLLQGLSIESVWRHEFEYGKIANKKAFITRYLVLR